MPINTKELRENRGTVAKSIRALADRQAQWTDADRTEWKALNERYDALSNDIRAAEIDEEMRSPADPDSMIGRHDPLRDQPDVRRQLYGDDAPTQPGSDFGLRFRDSRGRIMRAIAPQESFAAVTGRRAMAPGAVGRCLAAAISGRLDDLEDTERRAFLDHTTSTGGYLLNPSLAASVIDLARSASVCMRAGALTMPIEGEHRIATLLSDPTPYWRAEGAAVTASSMTFGRIDLVPKTIAAIIPVSVEMMEDAANIGSVIEMALAGAFGVAIDRAILAGTGDANNQPEGIITASGTNSIDAESGYLDYDLGRQAVLALRNANCQTPSEQLAWVMSPRDGATLDALTDGEGVWLTPPPSLAKMPWLQTTSIPTNLGTGTNESYAIMGDFSTVLFATRRTLMIRILDSGEVTDDEEEPVTHNAASELKHLIVAHARCDVALLRPSWVSKIVNVGPLPAE